MQRPPAKTRPPFPDDGARAQTQLPPCTVYRLRMATRRATRLYDRVLAPCGLGIAQFGLLMAVCARGGASVTDIATALDMDRTTLTRNLRPLLRARKIRIAPGPDRRSKAVTITPDGRRSLDEARVLWREAQATVRKSLGAAETEALHQSLAHAIERLPAD